jgi:hypothetical protein
LAAIQRIWSSNMNFALKSGFELIWARVLTS